MSSEGGSPWSKYRCLGAEEGFGRFDGVANHAFHVSVAIDGEEVSSRMIGGVDGSVFPVLFQWRSQLKEFKSWPVNWTFQLDMEKPP